MLNLHPAPRSGCRRRRARGQALVEFALTFPILLIMMMGFLEFAFMYNALLSAGHATRDSALIAAEAGNAASADCLILRAVEKDMTAPVRPAQIQQVQIYLTDAYGNYLDTSGNITTDGALNQAVDTYTRTGSTSCLLADLSTLTVPYSIQGSVNYDPTTRCNVVAGCPDATRPLDTIAVRITYRHTWVTPLSNLVNLAGSGATLVQSHAARMEPVL